MGQDLVTLAREINVRLDKAKGYEDEIEKNEIVKGLRKRADDHRVAAAMLLLDAKHRVNNGEEGEVTFKEWCKNNIHRSWRDVRKLVGYAESGNPAKAIEDERNATRERMSSHRAHKNVRPGLVSVDDAKASDKRVEAVISKVMVLTRGELETFFGWLESEYGLSIHKVADAA